jgi:hypothetical protein
MRIGIIGLEALEGHLRANLGKLEVSIATSKGPESLTAFASEISATLVKRSRQRRGGRYWQLQS